LPREAVEDRARLAMHALLADDGPWRRIADDVRATTGRDLLLRRGEPDVHRLNGPEEPDPTWLEIEVVLDGARVCSFGHSHSPSGGHYRRRASGMALPCRASDRSDRNAHW
jgi:hypothetical protein